MKTDNKFSPWQRIVCCLCFGAYLCAYLTRINISIALSDITSEIGLSTVEAGGITGMFFWTYAAGQLVSGWLGDRISPRFMIGIGLGVSSLINVLFSFAQSLPLMMILWTLNGVFQSMLWAPMMRTIVMNFEGVRLSRMMFIISLTLVFGYSISWSASTIIKHFLGWRFVFIVPAVLSAIFVAVWFIVYNPRRDVSVRETTEESLPPRVSPFRIKHMPLILVFLVAVCVVHGIVKESINIWLPTMLESAGTFSLSSTLGVLLIVPLINFCGVMLMKFIMSRGNSNTYKTLTLLLSVSLAVSVTAYIVSHSGIIALIAATIAMSGLMFATNPVLTAFAPLDFARWNCVSTVTGFIDCAIYLGAALSGILTGLIVDGNDWSGVALMWAVVLTAGVAASLLLRKFTSKMFYVNEQPVSEKVTVSTEP